MYKYARTTCHTYSYSDSSDRLIVCAALLGRMYKGFRGDNYGGGEFDQSIIFSLAILIINVILYV